MKSIFILIFLMISMDNFSQIIDKHQFNNRLLLIYTTDKIDATFKNQIQDIQQNLNGLKERNLIVYIFTKDTYQLLSDDKIFKIEKNNPFKKESSSFKLKLIGLDGGVKYTTTNFTPTIKIFEIIDAMPMRIRELKNKN